MPEQMPQVYEGDLPYIFVCYAHADRDVVLPIIRALANEGYRVWYDDGIKAGTHYPTYIAEHVKGCSLFIMFVSRASLDSDWCNNEVHYALDHGRQTLPVYLQDVELTSGLDIRIGRLQSLYWWKYGSSESFYNDLFEAQALDRCLTDEGEKRRQSRSLLVQRARKTLDADECSREILESMLDDLRALWKSLPRKDERVEQLMRELEDRLACEGEKDVRSATLVDSVTSGVANDSATSQQMGEDTRDGLSAGGNGVKPSETLRDFDSSSIFSGEEQKHNERRRDERRAGNKTSRRKSEGRKPANVQVTERKGRSTEVPRKPRRSIATGVAVAIVAVLIIAVVAFGASQLIGGLGQGTRPEPDNTASANDVTADVPDNADASHDAFVNDVDVKATLNDYSWDELKQLATSIAGASDDEWLDIAKTYNLVDADGKLQGDEKTFTLTDDTQASVRILGFRHDELADGGMTGITFEFADIPVTHRMNANSSNAGGWEESEMRAWLNSDFLNLMPEDLQSHIEAVKKRTNNVGLSESEDDTSVVTSTIDRLWLLSSNEVYGDLMGVYSAEGTQYQLYANEGVSTTSYAFCKKAGADSLCWLRSPYARVSNWFRNIHSFGDWDGSRSDDALGVSPAFCF